jgi:hypothetical protein
MLRRLAAAAAVLVASTLLPAVLTAGGASAGTEPDPMADAPSVGDCFDFTLTQGYGRSLRDEDPVDCAQGHRAVVAAVGKLPARLDWDSPERQLSKAQGTICSDGYDDLIGSNHLLRWYRSQYVPWRFDPTSAQRAHGARWFDCMISVQGARGLVDLPATLPRVTTNLPDSVARCVTSKSAYTTCAQTHAWRSSYAFYASGKATDRNVDAAANRVCPHHVTSRTWLRSAWDIVGKRYVVGCYSKTRR